VAGLASDPVPVANSFSILVADRLQCTYTAARTARSAAVPTQHASIPVRMFGLLASNCPSRDSQSQMRALPTVRLSTRAQSMPLRMISSTLTFVFQTMNAGVASSLSASAIA
jgi:hypothetical protein